MARRTKEELENILKFDFMENPNIFASGHRNDDAVDFCIICHCLGVDITSKFNELTKLQSIPPGEQMLCLAHISRVEPYLESWGERGTMEALDYSIDY